MSEIQITRQTRQRDRMLKSQHVKKMREALEAADGEDINAGSLMIWIDRQIQAAYQFGYLERDTYNPNRPGNHITDLNTLSNLYSKEQGFKP